MSRQTDHILYKFQGVQHKREAAGHRVTLVEEDRATTSGRSRAAIHRWTTVAKKPAPRWPHKATSHHNFWTPASALSATGKCDVGDRACLHRGRRGPASLTSHKSDRSAERCRERTWDLRAGREGMKILSSSAALHLPTVNAPRSGQATKQSKSTDDETHDNLAH